MGKRVTIESGKFYVYDDNGNAIPLTGIDSETDSKIYVSFDVPQQPLGIDAISDRISEMLETGDMDTYSLFSKIHAMYSDDCDKVRLFEKLVEYLFESYHFKNDLFVTVITSLEKDRDNTLKALKNIKKEL